MTFSLLGRCPRDDLLGVAIASSSPAVAARCAYARPGTGVAVSQNVTDPRLGPALLDALDAGVSAAAAVDRVAATAAHCEHRQLGAVDARGGVGAFTGPRALGRHGHCAGTDCLAAGNLLAHEDVLEGLIDEFERASGEHLGSRLVRALSAGRERSPVRSAGLLVAGWVPWPVADLRVDWHDDPVDELWELWQLWQPQLDDYVTRALDPERAPAFGVAGDERRQ
jgi:uncharacterized Ntn-hydrolase superfamily protein